MRIAGIIAEYDPFHKGHAAHIAATRAENGGNASHIVVVMSGNFTQRGEPALINKFYRTAMAIENGADLVLELPLPWAMAPAESFAAGGIAILKALGCVELLSFGSECGDLSVLQQLADLSNLSDYPDTLRQILSTGVPYAAAGQMTASRLLGEEKAAHLAAPNNTLGIEYIRAAQLQNAPFSFFTLQRQGALHNETAPKQGLASASLLRDMVRRDLTAEATAYMPESAALLLRDAVTEGKIALCTEKLEYALLAQLRRMSEEDYMQLPWLSEGIENRLFRISRTATNYADLLTDTKTRRYPMARLRRVLWSALLGITAADCTGLPPYIRVLGMNQRGREILNIASPTLPLLTRAAQIKQMNRRCQRLFSLECTATDLHALCTPTPNPCGTDCTHKILVK